MGKFELLFKFIKVIISFVGIIITFLRIPRYFELKKFLNRNVELKNKKNNTKCYICGLGPSLKYIDFAQLDGDTVVVNKFYNYDKDNIFKPTYYCIADEEFINGKLKEELFISIEKYKDTVFFVNDKFYKVLNERFPQNKNIYYACNWKGMFSGEDNIDYTKVMPIMLNAVAQAISLALFVGYKEIILIGCDFNMFASPKAIYCYKDDCKKELNLSLELFCFSFAADIHYELERYSKRYDIKIINATQGSLIDAYVRMPYNDGLKYR